MIELPKLSPSIAHTLISRSPAHAYQQHRLLGGQSKVSITAMDRGKILETMIFGLGEDHFSIIDADDFRKKGTQEIRDAAIDSGLLPMLRRQYDEYRIVADGIMESIAKLKIEFIGENQKLIEWTNDNHGTDIPVECKGYIDHYLPEHFLTIDLKCVEDARPSKCIRSMIDYGYDIQFTAYMEGIEKTIPEAEGRADVLYLFCEVEKPYVVTPLQPSGSMRDLGYHKWQRAVRTWGKCMQSNIWPGYTKGIFFAEAKPWQIDDEMSNEYYTEMESEQ